MRKFLTTLFSAIGVIWPSLFASIFFSAILCIPPQVHELDRILLEGDDWLRAASTFIFLVFSCGVISLMGRALLVAAKPNSFQATGSERAVVRYLPVACGSAVLFAAGLGLLFATKDVPTIALSGATVERSTSLAEIGRLTGKAASEARHIHSAGFFLLGIAIALFVVMGRRSSRAPRRSQFIAAHGRRTWVAGMLAVILLSILFSLFNGFAASLGTIAIVSIFVSIFVTILTGMQIASYRGAPILVFACLAAFVFSLLGWNDNHVIREKTLATPRGIFNGAGPQLEFESWYSSRKDLDHFTTQKRKYPVYIIASRGGGIYAAAQEALFLSRMQDQCPNFAQHVFAISGVSGGSIGAALFNSLVRTHVTNDSWKPCQFGALGTGPIEEHARSFLKTDFLSPIVASAFFPDFLERFLPFPVAGTDRGEALSHGLERAWRDAEPGTKNPFKGMFLEHWDPNSAAPALLLNTTEVDNGRRIVISPFALSPLRDASASAEKWFYQTVEMDKTLPTGEHEPPVRKDVKLSDAASMSARFPWILPAATIRRDGKIIRLVDGGYFDNSGVETALDLIEDLVNIYQVHQQYPNDAYGHPVPFDFEIHLITISGYVEDEPQAWQGLDEGLSPLRALLSSREARGSLSATKAQTGHYIFGSGTRTFDVRPAATLDEQDLASALGFQLSRNSLALIGAQVGEADQNGRVWGDAAIQDAETSDPKIAKDEHRIMDNIQANSYTLCQIKYSLAAQDMPDGHTLYPCDAHPQKHP